MVTLCLLAVILAGCSSEPTQTQRTPENIPNVTQTTVTTIPTTTPTDTTVTPTIAPTTTTQAIPTPGVTTHLTPIEFDYGVKYRVKVEEVVDGDTVKVMLSNHSTETVRLLGVDTPETYSDNKAGEYGDISDVECLDEWGEKAKEFACDTLEGRDAYIEFDLDSGLRGYYGRLLAYVYYKNVDSGDKVDFTAQLVREGYARVYTEGDFKKEDEYLNYQSKAKDEDRGLWGCGQATLDSSPQATTTTGDVEIIEAHYDAAGNDHENLNDEYIILKNKGDSVVNLGGWTLEDEAGHTYEFPEISLQPSSTLTVHTGSGTDSATDLYWGCGSAVWNNGGDTAYLYNQGGLVDEESW